MWPFRTLILPSASINLATANNVRIRVAKISDGHAVTNIVYKTFHEAQSKYGHEPDWTDRKFAEISVINSLNNPYISSFVAEEGTRIVGTATLRLSLQCCSGRCLSEQKYWENVNA